MSTKIKPIKVSTPYKEESVKIPSAITLIIIVLLTVPLAMWIIKINDEGTRAANVARYNTLIATVDHDVRTVRALLGNDAEELAAIREARKTATVTLIVPEVVILEQKTDGQNVAPLKVTLDGVYWSPSNPLASIDGETYRVGDVIQGYEIVRIDKTSVQFQSSDGTIVKKDMYDDLLKGSSRK